LRRWRESISSASAALATKVTRIAQGSFGNDDTELIPEELLVELRNDTKRNDLDSQFVTFAIMRKHLHSKIASTLWPQFHQSRCYKDFLQRSKQRSERQFKLRISLDSCSRLEGHNFDSIKGKELRPYCKLTLDGTSEDHPVITTVSSESAYPIWDPQNAYSFMVSDITGELNIFILDTRDRTKMYGFADLPLGKLKAGKSYTCDLELWLSRHHRTKMPGILRMNLQILKRTQHLSQEGNRFEKDSKEETRSDEDNSTVEKSFIPALDYEANLRTIMKDDPTITYMRKFIQGSYDEKALNLWQALREIEQKSLNLLNHILTKTEDLDEEFLKTSAPSELNVSQQFKNAWKEARESQKPTRIFSALKSGQAEIMSLVEKDSFMRFKKSPEWRECKLATMRSPLCSLKKFSLHVMIQNVEGMDSHDYKTYSCKISVFPQSTSHKRISTGILNRSSHSRSFSSLPTSSSGLANRRMSYSEGPVLRKNFFKPSKPFAKPESKFFNYKTKWVMLSQFYDPPKQIKM